jgi:succinyl-CoA synthetase alpha subunit
MVSHSGFVSLVNVVKRNLFRDSIQLMRLSEDVKKLDGVDDAVVSMGTDTNRRLLKDLGLLGNESRSAGDGDLIIAVRVSGGFNVGDVMARVEQLVMAPPAPSGGTRTKVFHSVESALEAARGANLAIVSLPGKQAFEPTMELLKRRVNVHLFSDHVPLEQELKLKQYASTRGLLVMGPGAGTSIINGVGLGFANSVRRGDVGIVASAGTGIQEVSIMLDRIGLGVSAALGVGGTDVSEQVGGLMMKDCLRLLDNDRGTRMIMIVAKTPKAKVISEVMEHVERKTSKPVVACFLGLDPPRTTDGRVTYAKTLHSAVHSTARASGREYKKQFDANISTDFERLSKAAGGLRAGLGATRKFARGLYSGGTLAHETLLIFRELTGGAYSNTPLSDEFKLADPNVSRGNSVVDLGDESFTAGRAHPMIDPTLRKLRIAQEARDPRVALLLLDVVLGYGSSPDPGGALAGVIEDAVRGSGKGMRGPAVMAHVCGTETDPQSLSAQSERLSSAGALLFSSNALLSAEAALVVGGEVASARLKQKWSELFG